MSIAGLIRRLVKGSPLTAADHDGNLDALEAAIEAVETTPGPAGAAGPPGTAATIAVGAATTGEPGTSATVTNTGTSSAAVLAFTIPRGATGAAGAAGATGTAATIAVGTVTTGAPGSSASVVNSGTSSAVVLDISIPRGNTGDQGPAGAKGDTGNTGSPGAAATISVGTVTTGAAGSSATVTNVGTSAAAVLNFTIPAGATGPQGAAGPAGTTTWTGITDKPSTFAPSAHASSHQTGGADEVPATYGTVAQITADTNNLTLPAKDVVFLSSDAPRRITGFVCTRPQRVINTGAHDLTVPHDSASSSTANRVLVPWLGDYVIEPGYGLLLLPDPDAGKLRAGL